MELNTFENQVYCAYSPVGENVTMQYKIEAQHAVFRYSQDLPILSYCYSNFFNFRFPTSYAYTFQITKLWLKCKIDVINASGSNTVSLIKDFLFGQIQERFSSFTPNIMKECSEAQAMFVLQYFESWDNFFDFIVGTPYELCFYSAFSSLLINPTPNNFQKIGILKENLRNSKVSSQISNLILKELENNSSLAYEAASNVVGWIDIQTVVDNYLQILSR